MHLDELREWIRKEGRWEFARAGGPGGQNVNKVSSKAILRVPVDRLPVSASDLERVRDRLGGRITGQGELVIHASESRSQARNRERAEERALHLISGALVRPKRRRPTRPSRAAVERRLAAKRRRAELKRLRRDPGE